MEKVFFERYLRIQGSVQCEAESPHCYHGDCMREALDECLSLGEQSCKWLVHISSMEVINHAHFVIVVMETIWTWIWVQSWLLMETGLNPLGDSQIKHRHDVTALCWQPPAMAERVKSTKEVWLLNQTWNCSDCEQTSQRRQNTPRRTIRRGDGHSQTDGQKRRKDGRDDGRRWNHRPRRRIGVKEERNSEREGEGRGMRGRNGKEEPCVVHLRSV